jgi:nucleoside-diphosphate-sugar epimerase
MQKKRRTLITGHNGYLGSVMAAHFLKAGHEVAGLDTGYFEPCTLVSDNAHTIPASWIDLREAQVSHLQGFDTVVHLAALSNDPIGNLNSKWTEDINYRASMELAEMAKHAGVRRFLFSSSCIMYGTAAADVVNEDSPLAPQTEYARSKVKCEEAISKLADDQFSPTFLRNGTVYGLSPRMRFDTVLNNFVGSALATGKVTVYSDGTPWRPVVHVEDVARAFLAVAEAPLDLVHNRPFNTGADFLNVQISTLAGIVADLVPGCKLEIVAQAGVDQRTYRTDFSRFARTFPSFEFLWTPSKGARRLQEDLAQVLLTEELFTDKRFTRLKWLRHLLESGHLDGNLRWTGAPIHSKNVHFPNSIEPEKSFSGRA